MEQILSEILIIKWLLIILIIIFGIMTLGIFFIMYKTRDIAGNETFFQDFSDEARDLLDKGMTDEVIKKASKRITSHPKDKYAHWYLASAYQEKKEYTKALETFTNLENIAPEWKKNYIEPNIDNIKGILKNTKPEVVKTINIPDSPII